MAIEIGRLRSFALGMEATPGTADTMDAWVPLEEGKLIPKVELTKDESGLATIAGGSDAHLTKTWSEFEGKGLIRPTSFGWLLLLAMGTVAAPALQEIGVYKHAFTLKNDNSHPSCTLVHDNATQEETSTYNMIESLTMTFEVGEIAKFDVKMKGRAISSTTGNTPAFTTETPFVTARLGVKFASAIAGLAGASVVGVKSVKITIDKNLAQVFRTLTTGVTDATSFVTQHNQDIRLSGDFEIVYEDGTYKTLALAGTKQAIQLDITGRTLIGVTKYDQLTVQVASATLEDWDRSADLNGIVSQSFGMKAMYKLAELKLLTVDLTNTKTTQYA